MNDTTVFRPPSSNRLTAMQFVLAFGVVSMLADVVYEGARAITGPYLATFGASAALVGFVTGLGEGVALVFRLATGRISDRAGRHWTLSIAGYAITVIAVPVLGITQTLWQAAALVLAERFGKAVRTPARDTMLAQASSDMGRGIAFAIHEALDQSGALLGPLLVAGMIAVSGYRLAFVVLAAPGILTLLTLAWLHGRVPRPSAYELPHPNAAAPGGVAAQAGLPAQFWLYTAFTAASMAGFATFGVLSYHMEVRQVLPPVLMPVAYAAAMVGAAARNRRFSAMTDLVYMNASLTTSTSHLSSFNPGPGPDRHPALATTQHRHPLGATVWSLAGVYTVVDGGWGNLDVVAGMRMLAIDSTRNFTLSADILLPNQTIALSRSGSASVTISYFNAIGGMTGRINIPNSKFYLPSYADVGGGGIPLT